MINILTNVAPKGVAPSTSQTRSPRDAWGYKPPISQSDDLRRIAALPRRMRELDGTSRAEALVDLMTERFARRRRTPCRCAALTDGGECITRLRLVQAVALREIGICGGLLGPIGVGHGKTMIDLLAPLALTAVGVKHVVLLVPPGLATQLVGDYLHVGQHFHVPQIVFHGVSYDNTGRGSDDVPLEPGAPVMHVVPYSRLSRPESTTWLEQQLRPDAIVADECHKLRNVKTATGARVDRYMREHPTTLFVGLSGSMTSRTLRDYDHLARWALRGGSPLPLDPEVTVDWCRALDPSDNPAEPGPLIEALCDPGEHVVDGFRRRLAETLGVVTTTAPPVDVLLEIDERPAPPIPPVVEEALASVRGFVRPDGEELVDALQVAKCACEVAAGFYYKWVFPRCQFPRDESLVEEWRDARKEWHREVREKLQRAEEHLDSPKLCQNAAERAHGERPPHRGLPTWQARTWARWRGVRDKIYHETRTVRLDDYLVRDVVAWAKQATGIVWYEHHAFGEWVAEQSGLPIYGGGPNGGGLLDETGRIRESGDRSVILSIRAHGTGRNGLQERYSRALLPNVPASPDAWEQVLGRLHRIGQRASSVQTWFYRHTKELRSHVDKALQAAIYVEGTMGSVQKLRLGFRLG